MFYIRQEKVYFRYTFSSSRLIDLVYSACKRGASVENNNTSDSWLSGRGLATILPTFFVFSFVFLHCLSLFIRPVFSCQNSPKSALKSFRKTAFYRGLLLVISTWQSFLITYQKKSFIVNNNNKYFFI